jgi:hypothetical protein
MAKWKIFLPLVIALICLWAVNKGLTQTVCLPGCPCAPPCDGCCTCQACDMPNTMTVTCLPFNIPAADCLDAGTRTCLPFIVDGVIYNCLPAPVGYFTCQGHQACS